MDINRFTEKAQEAILSAQKLAARNGQQQIDSEHLLLALLEQEDGIAPAILRRRASTSTSSRDRVDREVERLPKVSGGSDQPQPGPRLNRV